MPTKTRAIIDMENDLDMKGLFSNPSQNGASMAEIVDGWDEDEDGATPDGDRDVDADIEREVEAEAEADTESEDAATEEDDTDEDGAGELDQDEDEDEEDEPTERLLRLKVRGKEIELPESEVIARAQKATSYDQQSQALAEERRQFEAEQQELENQRQQLGQRFQQQDQELQVLEQFVTSQIGPPPDPTLAGQDPQGFAVAQATRQQRIEQFQQLRQQRIQNAQQAEQQAAANYEAARKKAVTQIQREIPEWADRKVMEREYRAMQSWALDRGYDPKMVQWSISVPWLKDLHGNWKRDTVKTAVKKKRTARPATRQAPARSSAPSANGTGSLQRELKQAQAKTSKATGAYAQMDAIADEMEVEDRINRRKQRRRSHGTGRQRP